MNAGRPNILICDPIHDDGVALLRQHTTVDIRPGLARGELEAIVGDYDALIVRSATKIPASVIERGHKLRAIGRAGSGLDGIDVAAARARGIEVLNCPDANSLAVAEHSDLPNLLREADFVTLHVPLRPETRGLVGAGELALMKPSAYLINTARGETLDERALLAALDGGRLAGAALDVFAQEPVVDH